MTITSYRKLSKHIFRLLKVSEIVFPIGRTNHGDLGVKFDQNSEDFILYLDAVPLRTVSILEDENNIELKKMVEKYFFDLEDVIEFTSSGGYTTYNLTTNSDVQKLPDGQPKGIDNIKDDGTFIVEAKAVPGPFPKKRGRPAGSKNKK